MSSMQPGDKSQFISNHSMRTIILFLGGLFLLGIALALLLFGQPLLDGFMGEPSVELPQIPSASGESNLISPVGPPLTVGDTAYDFTLSDLDGNTIALSDFSGQPLIVNFWATWCAPCRLEMPHLQNAYETYQDQGLAILAVNQQEQEGQVRSFFDELGFTFTPLLDSEGSVGAAYGAFGLPSTYFIDETRKVTAVHRGILSEGQIDDYLAQTLSK